MSKLASVPSVAAYEDNEDNGIYNAVAIILRCKHHKNIGLTKLPGKDFLWFPISKLSETENASSAAAKLLAQLLKSPKGDLQYTAPQFVQLCRFQINKLGTFAELTLFGCEVKPTASGLCCRACTKLEWFTKLTIDEPRVWGPEPAVYKDVNNPAETNFINSLHEFTVSDVVHLLPRGPPRSVFDQLLESAKMEEKDLRELFAEFVKHCYPSRSMNLTSFVDYMSRTGWGSDEKKLERTYRSFKVHEIQYVRINEFVFGLAAFGRKTEHKEKIAKLRCHYIFRYYDDNNDGSLSPHEMLNLHRDILEANGTTSSEEDALNLFFLTCSQTKVSLDHQWPETKIIEAVQEKALRGTAGLCRAPGSVMATRLYELSPTASAIDSEAKTIAGPLCAGCKPKHYVLANNEVTLNVDGVIVDSKPIKDADENSQSISKVQAIDLFDAKSPVNKLLKWIRQYWYTIQPSKAPKGAVGRNFYTSETEQEVAQVVNAVITQAKQMFSKEPRVLRINSPCHVLGDIHGNLYDLMAYEQMLWRRAPFATAGAHLFLGDYVDRGDYGVEVVLYLFCMKLLAPGQFYLIRGNHEVRQLQKTFTFTRECEKKFGDLEIWNSLNLVFDMMPLCAVIDGHIFCSHGGIPTTIQELSALGIPRPLSDPEAMSPSAWEILWNDPINANEFSDYTEQLRVTSGQQAIKVLGGFLGNTKRGTAYFFSQEAVESFLRTNGLSHIIRAHEVMNEGYRFFHQGKTATVFSSSRYCNGTNEAACILVADQKLRVIKLDSRSRL
ncbi:Serine/threonine-protein phosphatase PP2A-like PPG1 [Halotydeus destructor]|nr:Serine/threonine-protein phosphatase PP2A-like PPG1 [Halotydeus destructor]